VILDSDVLITLLDPRCPRVLTERLAATPDVICTTSICWAEIVYGLIRRAASQRLRARYEDSLLPALEVLSFDKLSAETYGEIRVRLECQGTPLDEADLMIAAIALRHDLPIATGNVRHFERVPGLRVEDWLG